MKINYKRILLALAMASAGTHADSVSFGTGTNQFSMDFVNIGHAGNAGDVANFYNGGNPGSVGYAYRMGTTEVTIDQFTKALILSFWRLNLGNENYWNDGFRTVGGNAPATFTTFAETAQFANWLTSGDSRYGAYTLNTGGYAVTSIDRVAAISTYGTVYVIPTEDEWYKAAYFKSDGSGYTTYAHGNSVPGMGTDTRYGSEATPWEIGSGTVENNGTFDMDGNVWEWFESPFDPTFDPDDSGIRGGSFDAGEVVLRSSFRLGDFPDEFETIGFRVAAIPEPSSVLLLTIGSGGLLFYRRAKRREQENSRPSRRDFN